MTAPGPARLGTVRERDANVLGARLRCWDTEEPGVPVVLLHGAIGNGSVWTHQHASLARAGLRSISYSRRGHRGSDPVAAPEAGSSTADLLALMAALELDRFHLVGTAHGGFTAIDAALLCPERILSLTVSSSLCGIGDPDFVATTRRLVPPPWNCLPAKLRELGPAYRAADPAGVRAWAEAADDGPEAGSGPVSAPGQSISLQTLGSLAVRTQFITGDADPYVPPPRMRAIAAAVPGSTAHVIQECGHSPYWEQPETFDRLVIRFVQGG